MNTAAKVREAKEKHPEQFCSRPGCLWRTHSGRDGRYLGPCLNHTLIAFNPIPAPRGTDFDNTD